MKNTHLPTGWQEKKIGEIFSFIKNYSNSRAELNDYDNISYIHYGDIHKHYRHRIECDKVDFPKISAEKLSKDINNISYVENGDLIVVDASEDYEGTCISAEIKNLNYKLVSGLHTFLLRDKNKIFADGYRGYILYNHDVHIQCCKVATGISVYGVSQENLKNIKIMIPPLDEQKRIAEVLSLCDDIIENLTELIDKKEQYKKGVMQRVLSGEVRFKGFTDKWKVFKLKEIGNIISGSGFPIKYQGKQIGEIAFIKVSDMNLKDNSIFIKKANNYINENELKELKAKIVPIDSIVFAKIGEAVKLERKRIISIKTCIDNNMSALVPFDNFNKKYIFYLLNNYKLSKHLNFSALPSLNMSDILDIEFLIPNIEEQNKISSFFSLIDEDIENLKKQLELRKQQKKGLMQRLLTGEVRI